MLLTVALGLLVGIIMGLTGAGGGILAVPMLVFGLHLTISQAGPVGLLAVGTAAAVGAIVGLRAKIVRYRAAMLIAVSGIVLTPFGVWLAHRLDTKLLSIIFAGVLVWVGYNSVKRVGQNASQVHIQDTQRPCIRSTESGRFVWTSKCARALVLFGGIAGVLSGLLGVGGGFVMVPALQRYTDLEARSVVATTLAVIALISLAGVATSVLAGKFDLGVGLPFTGGAVLGMGIGTLLSSRLAPSHLRVAFAFVCLAVAVGMVAKSI